MNSNKRKIANQLAKDIDDPELVRKYKCKDIDLPVMSFKIFLYLYGLCLLIIFIRALCS